MDLLSLEEYEELGVDDSQVADQPVPVDDFLSIDEYEEIGREDSPGFVGSVKRGVDELQGALYGATGLVGSAIGSDKVRDWGMEGYHRNMEEAQANPSTQRLKDIRSFDDTVTWTKETLGALVPSMVSAFMGGGVGAGVGKFVVRKGVDAGMKGALSKTVLKKQISDIVEDVALKKGIEGEAKELLRQEVTKAALTKLSAKAGVGGAVLPMEAGGNYAELLSEHGVDAPYSALGTGALATSLEFLGGNIRLIDKLMPGAGGAFKKAAASGKPGLIKRTSKEIVKNVPAEMLQEGGQEALSALNVVANTDEKLFTQENIDRVVESMGAGGLGGLFGGGVSGVFSRSNLENQQDDSESSRKEPKLVDKIKAGMEKGDIKDSDIPLILKQMSKDHLEYQGVADLQKKDSHVEAEQMESDKLKAQLNLAKPILDFLPESKKKVEQEKLDQKAKVVSQAADIEPQLNEFYRRTKEEEPEPTIVERGENFIKRFPGQVKSVSQATWLSTVQKIDMAPSEKKPKVRINLIKKLTRKVSPVLRAKDPVEKSKQIAKKNPELVSLLGKIAAGEIKTTKEVRAELEKRFDSREIINKELGKSMETATPEELQRARAVFRHKKRGNIVKTIDDEFARRRTAEVFEKTHSRKPKERKYTTLGGAIRAMGGVRVGKNKTDILYQNDTAQKSKLLNEKSGLEIEEMQTQLIEDGWMLPSENLTQILSENPDRLREGKLDAEAKTKFQKEKAEEIQAQEQGPDEPTKEEMEADPSLAEAFPELAKAYGITIDTSFEFGENERPKRFETGKKLSKEERKKVLSSVGDAYKDNDAPKGTKGFDQNGEEIVGYLYSPEHMHVSDITGQKIRHYISLPDGRKAHPSELYPEITESEIKAALRTERQKEQNKKIRLEELKKRATGVKNINDANGKANAVGFAGRLKDSVLLENQDGDLIRLPSDFREDIELLKDNGFTVKSTFKDGKKDQLAPKKTETKPEKEETPAAEEPLQKEVEPAKKEPVTSKQGPGNIVAENTPQPESNDRKSIYKKAQENLESVLPTMMENADLVASPNVVLMNVRTLDDKNPTKIGATYDGTKEDALRVAKAVRLRASEEYDASMQQSEMFATDSDSKPKYAFTQGKGVTEIHEVKPSPNPTRSPEKVSKAIPAPIEPESTPAKKSTTPAVSTQGAELSKKAAPATSGKAEKVAAKKPPMLHKSRTPQKHGTLPINQVKKMARRVSKNWKNAPEIVVVQKQSELPANIFKSGEGDIVDGAYYDGKVFLVSENMKDLDYVAKVLLHESFGHYGLRGTLGDHLKPTLRRVYKAKRAEVQKIGQEYGFDLKTDQGRNLAAEEWLAREAQENPKSKWIDRVVAAIRAFVRKFHPNFKMSDAEIRNILKDAKRYVRINKKQKALREGMPMFSKKSREDYIKDYFSEYVAPTEEFKTAKKKLATGGDIKTLKKESKGLRKWIRNKLGKGFVDDDMKLFHRVFGLPYWLGKKFPSMAEAMGIEVKGQENRSTFMEGIYSGKLGKIQDAIPKDKKALAEFKSIIWKWDGKRFDTKDVPTDWHEPVEASKDIKINPGHYKEVEAYLKKQGHSQKAIDAFIAVRETLDKTLVDIDKVMRIEKLDPTDIEEFRASVGKIHNYFPHSRKGDAYITIKKKEAGVPSRDWETVYSHQYNTWNKISNRPPQVRVRVKEWLEKEIEAGRLQGSVDDYRISKPKKVTKLPDEVFFQIPAESMQHIIDVAGKKVADQRVKYEADRLYNKEGRTKEEALKEARRKLTADIGRSISKAAADVLKSRGFGGHMIGRKGTPGYETEDVFGILFDYLSGYGGFKTKIVRARKHHENLMNIDPKRQREEYRYTSKYVQDMLANQDGVDRAVDTIRGVFFVKYLGFVIKSGLVNLSQNVVLAAPVLSMHTKGAHRKIAKAMVDVRTSMISKEAWTGKQIEYTNLNKREQKALHDIYEAGASMDLFLRELKGNLPGKSLGGKIARKVIDTSGIFMQVAEKMNRASTGLAAYRVGMEKGMDHDNAVQFAKDIIYDSHFLYGKLNMPSAMRGGDIKKILRSTYTFRTFTHNYLSAIAHMLLNQGLQGKKAVALSFRNLFLVGGLSSIPFFKALSEALLWAIGDDDEDAMTLARKYTPGSTWVKDMVVYGIPGGVGMDLTGSLSIEVPRSWKDIVGVPYAAIDDSFNTINSLKSGQKYRALSETPFTPIAMRNAMRGIELFKSGHRTRSGKDINAPHKVGARKITTAAMFRKSILGLQPTSVSRGYGAYQATQKASNLVDKKKTYFANRYVNALRNRDHKARQKVIDDIRAWNRNAKRKNKLHLIINIKDMVKSRIRPQIKTIPKKFRREAIRIANEWQ